MYLCLISKGKDIYITYHDLGVTRRMLTSLIGLGQLILTKVHIMVCIIMEKQLPKLRIIGKIKFRLKFWNDFIFGTCYQDGLQLDTNRVDLDSITFVLNVVRLNAQKWRHAEKNNKKCFLGRTIHSSRVVKKG